MEVTLYANLPLGSLECKQGRFDDADNCLYPLATEGEEMVERRMSFELSLWGRTS